jgi:hypothetical protein
MKALVKVLSKIIARYELPPPVSEWLLKSEVDWTLKSIAKFAAGQQEHGGNFFACDFKKETLNEILDLKQYYYGHLWRDEFLTATQKHLNDNPTQSQVRT